ncbi:MAG TPA: glycosyltransferase [Solirubrobacteraceae bacterium]|nr:glycosyltransferase [Solirubrobacteraceae bacterium]
MAADNGDITAVVACFNYGAYLPEAVDSLLGQAGGAPRVVVVDDGSDDPGTLAALDDLRDGVELVRQPNRGVGAARNAGLERAEETYAIVLDADDRLAPGALAALRAPLDADPGLGFAYGTMRFFGDWKGELRFPAYDPYALLYRHTIGLSALVRRDVIEATGGFDPAFEHFEDWELWVNALAHGWRGCQIDAVTLEYRRHGATKLAADRSAYRRAFRRLRTKHAALYRDRAGLARESRLGPAGRLWYRAWWGARPVPARLERALHRARWRGAAPAQH